MEIVALLASGAILGTAALMSTEFGKVVLLSWFNL